MALDTTALWAPAVPPSTTNTYSGSVTITTATASEVIVVVLESYGDTTLTSDTATLDSVSMTQEVVSSTNTPGMSLFIGVASAAGSHTVAWTISSTSLYGVESAYVVAFSGVTTTGALYGAATSPPVAGTAGTVSKSQSWSVGDESSFDAVMVDFASSSSQYNLVVNGSGSATVSAFFPSSLATPTGGDILIVGGLNGATAPVLVPVLGWVDFEPTTAPNGMGDFFTHTVVDNSAGSAETIVLTLMDIVPTAELGTVPRGEDAIIPAAGDTGVGAVDERVIYGINIEAILAPATTGQLWPR